MGGRQSTRKYYPTSQATRIIRYAPYIEPIHAALIVRISNEVDRQLPINPYSEFTFTELDSYYFGVGNTLGDFSNLFNLYKTFIEDVNLNAIFISSETKVLDKDNLIPYIEEKEAQFNDVINEEKLNKLSAEVREINSICSSTFIINKTLLEKERLQAIAEVSKNMTSMEIEKINFDSKIQVEHTQNIPDSFSAILMDYISTEITMTEDDYSYLAKQYLWPFTLLDMERIVIAVLEIPQIDFAPAKPVLMPKTQKDKLIDYWSGAMQGEVQGGMMGTKYGGWVGTIIGVAVGHLIGGWSSYYAQ